MQESIANALELCLSCTNPSISCCFRWTPLLSCLPCKLISPTCIFFQMMTQVNEILLQGRKYTDDLIWYSGKSNALALELLQSCTQLLISSTLYHGYWWPGDTSLQGIMILTKFIQTNQQNSPPFLTCWCTLTLVTLDIEYSGSEGQYHACWCPGNLSCQGISRNGIDNIE